MFQTCPCSYVHTLVAQPSHFWPLRLKALTTARTSNIRQNPWPLYRIWCIVTQKRPKTIVDRFLVGFWFCLSTFPLGQPRFGGADSDFRPMEPVPKRMDCHQQRCKVKKYPTKMLMWPAMLQIYICFWFLHKKLACRVHGLIHNQPSVRQPAPEIRPLGPKLPLWVLPNTSGRRWRRLFSSTKWKITSMWSSRIKISYDDLWF